MSKHHHSDAMIVSPEDFWKYVDRCDGRNCWNWMRGVNGSGYGSVRFMGKKRSAHRVAYFLSHGGINLDAPADRKSATGFVLHKCDNRRCCNPDHLFLGTYNENIQDMVRKGRSAAPRGEEHPKARLTNAQAAQIRRLLKSGHTRREMQDRFGVSERIVGRIANNEGYINAGE